MDRARVPDRGERGFRRAVGWGLLLSAAVHGALVLAWRSGPTPSPGLTMAETPREPVASTAPASLRAVRLRVATSPVPAPPPPLDPIEVEIPEVVARDESVLSTVRLEARAAPRPEVGADAPEGQAGSGTAVAFTPAVPRSVLPEWDPPESVTGLEVTVRVHVDARGRPTGAVELLPPTPSEAFNERLVEKIRRMAFRPARRGGRPVAAWAELTFVF